MDKQEQYRKLIKQILIEHAQHKFSYGDIKIETIFDDEHNHYQLFHIGWHGNRHVYGCVMHLEIENGKIWIHHDGDLSSCLFRSYESFGGKIDI